MQATKAVVEPWECIILQHVKCFTNKGRRYGMADDIAFRNSVWEGTV